jgi:hypothetical protein
MAAVIGTLVAVLISLLSVPGMASWAKLGITNVQKSVMATQLMAFDKAAQQYVQDNAAAIAAVATATTPVTVTAANLQAANYLPAGFSAKNPFQQTLQLQVLQPSAGQLQALVTSQGGTPISDTKELVQIAAQAGAQGGFIPYANQAGDATMTPTNAYGAYGAWKLPMTGYTNPGSGHLASLLIFSGSQANNGFLYRVAVPGQPQLNDMQTDLGMTDVGGTAHNITGANQISTQSLKALANGTKAVPSVQLANGTVVAYNQVGEGGVLGLTGANGQSIYLESLNGTFRLVNNPWNLALFTVDQNGNVSATGTVTAPTVNFNTTAANCTWNTVTMRLNNQMWVCNQWGNWVPISQLIGNVQTVNKFLGYMDGWGVGKPTCTGGTPTATIIPQTNGVNVAANPPWETTVYKLIDEGTWWYVQIAMIDTNGNWFSGNNLGLTGEVDTQCTYNNT